MSHKNPMAHSRRFCGKLLAALLPQVFDKPANEEYDARIIENLQIRSDFAK
jgi:hypothetical protein